MESAIENKSHSLSQKVQMTWWSCELIWNFSYINPSPHFILGMRGREPFSSPLIYYRPNILFMLECTATENIFKNINDADSMLNWLDTLQIYLWHLNCSDGMFMFWLQLYLLWSALCKNIWEVPDPCSVTVLGWYPNFPNFDIEELFFFLMTLNHSYKHNASKLCD